jgi:hypothetical protein
MRPGYIANCEYSSSLTGLEFLHWNIPLSGQVALGGICWSKCAEFGKHPQTLDLAGLLLPAAEKVAYT